MSLRDQNRITENDWSDLHRRERVYLAVTGGFVPAMVVALLIASTWSGDVPRWFGWFAGLAGMGAFVAVSMYLRHFRCPRCEQPFLGPAAGRQVACMHCRLKRDTVGIARRDGSKDQT